MQVSPTAFIPLFNWALYMYSMVNLVLVQFLFFLNCCSSGLLLLTRMVGSSIDMLTFSVPLSGIGRTSRKY